MEKIRHDKDLRDLTRDEIFDKIEGSSQRMIDALVEAGRHMPPDLSDEQKELFHRLFASAESLKEKLDKAIIVEESHV